MSLPQEWYTVDEAAAYLGVSRRTVYKLCKEGRLPTYVLSKQRTRRFRKGDLDSVPQAMETMAGPKKPFGTADALSAEADPVLAELWDNDKDAAYDAS